MRLEDEMGNTMGSFQDEVAERLASNGADAALVAQGASFVQASVGPNYSYNSSWMGRPIIQSCGK